MSILPVQLTCITLTCLVVATFMAATLTKVIQQHVHNNSSKTTTATTRILQVVHSFAAVESVNVRMPRTYVTFTIHPPSRGQEKEKLSSLRTHPGVKTHCHMIANGGPLHRRALRSGQRGPGSGVNLVLIKTSITKHPPPNVS